jgi:hypothetical protein
MRIPGPDFEPLSKTRSSAVRAPFCFAAQAELMFLLCACAKAFLLSTNF